MHGSALLGTRDVSLDHFGQGVPAIHPSLEMFESSALPDGSRHSRLRALLDDREQGIQIGGLDSRLQ